jgi:DNA-binding CsgD family transcriptional regulator
MPRLGNWENSSPMKGLGSSGVASQFDEPESIQVSTDVLAAVDMLNFGILVVDREGRITFANQVAKEFLKRRRTINLRAKGPLSPLGAAVFRQKESQHHLIPSSKGGQSLIALIVPSCNQHVNGSPSASILFLSELRATLEMDLRPVARLYKLTRAETRLLYAILRGDRISTYANQAGITLNTAKTHLKQLFSKTEARRQADLVRLVLGNPVLWLVSRRSVAVRSRAQPAKE